MRAAVSYSLVLALVAGPLLCCCTAAHLSPPTSTQPPAASVHGPAKSCCGEAPKPADEHHAPADHHAPCPCKDAAANPALPETAAGTGNPLALLPVGLVAFASLLPPALPALLVGTTPTHFRPLSAADLLFVHHNLRC